MPGWKKPEYHAPANPACARGKLLQSVDPLPSKRNISKQKKTRRKRSLMSLYHEVMEALTPLIEAFERLGITYYIGGSVSSSLHGLVRRTQDVDVIVAIGSSQVRLLVQRLQPDYYVDEQAWQDAVRRGLPYSVIHLDTMVKIDLMPLKQRAFTREEASRAQAHVLEAGMRPVRVASAEDAILTKLEWFEMGGHSSSDR